MSTTTTSPEADGAPRGEHKAGLHAAGDNGAVEHPHDAELVDDEPIVATIDETDEVAVDKTALVRNETIVIAEPDPEPAFVPQPQVVYVTVPHPPKAKGNRLFGVLIALGASIVYAAALAFIFAIVWASITGGADLAFIGSANFFIPVAFFLAATILLALIANRAGWWAWVLGSIIVAVVVYFGIAGTLLLVNNVVLETPESAANLFRQSLLNPLVFISAILAREVAVWAGKLVSARGRRVKARNVEARAAYDLERAAQAAQRP